MGLRLILIFFALNSGCVAQPIAQKHNNQNPNKFVSDKGQFKGEAAIILNSGLDAYKNTYITEPLHKAFAQSDDGTWFWKSRELRGHPQFKTLLRH